MADTLCRVEIEHVRGFPVARLAGEVDVSNVDHIENELDAAAGRSPLFVVDLTRTEYFDSAGIRLLFTFMARLKTRRQELHVIVPRGAVIMRVLEITDFMRVVPVHENLDEIVGLGDR